MRIFKFLPVFAVFLTMFGYSSASFAACIVEACGGKGNDCISAYDLVVDPGKIGEINSYICEKGHCANGDIVHDLRLEKFYVCRIASDSGVNFFWAGDDTWEEYPVQNCQIVEKDGYIKQQDNNSTKVLRNSTQKTETFRKNDTGSLVIGVGQDICLEYKCNDGYINNTDHTACVSIAEQQEQKRLADLKAECAKIVGGKVNDAKNGCDCVTPGFEIVGNRCVDPNIAKLIAANEAKCRAGDGTWKGGETWNDADCECKTNMAWDNTKNPPRCDLTAAERNRRNQAAAAEKAARRKACEAVANTVWNDAGNGTCTCTEPNYGWVESQKQCVLDKDVAACNQIEASGQKVTWDSVLKKCVCTEQGYELRSNICVETEAARQKRLTDDALEQKRIADEKIEAEKRAKKELENKQSLSKSKIKRASESLSGFDLGGVSVWKTADGKFNTSRLVSDSVAGVVLGTAGGLITSNVIKKNQIKSGFEDISCSVGGQVVADWGDDFSVGIR